MSMKSDLFAMIAQLKRQTVLEVDALIVEYPGASCETMEAVFAATVDVKHARRVIERMRTRRPDLTPAAVVELSLTFLDAVA